jgi:hypothetical protein
MVLKGGVMEKEKRRRGEEDEIESCSFEEIVGRGSTCSRKSLTLL